MKRKTGNNITKLISVIILGFILVWINQKFGAAKDLNKQVTSLEGYKNIQIQVGEDCSSSIPKDSSLRVFYFDVGQADSILVVDNEKTMLIDAGNNEDGEVIVNNLKSLGITKLDYLVGTHPHEDHIGGLDNIIDNFDVDTIYMPKVQTNTKTFEDVLDAIDKKNLKISTPVVGDKFLVGNSKCEIMSIGSNDNNLNECSIVIRLERNDISYLFMGDAEEKSEIARDWPQTTILKVGHHGSSSSSSQRFLEQVMPTVSIISVGKDNKYGHPHKETLEKLNKINTTVYTTQNSGNILIIQN